MSTIVTRAGKGSALTHNEVDANFTNLNTDKLQSGNTAAALTITSATINGGTISGIVDLAVADGGTGGSDASTARTNLNAQEKLVSGTNIKTINSTSILGSGDIAITASVSDGDKGDITVSASGATWTIEASSVSPDKLSTQSQYTGFKNRIINGAMAIDQRNAGAARTIANGSYAYTIDRWRASSFGATCTGQQIFSTNQYLYQFTGAASVTNIDFNQRIESKNCLDLASQTVSFSAQLANSLLTSVTWQISYATATDNFTSTTLISSGTFTVNSTLTTYSIQVALPANAINGLQINLTIGAQTSGTWKIGNAQLEKGTQATSFDYRPYGTELALCQRYFEMSYAQGTVPGTATQSNASFAYLAGVTTFTGGTFFIKYSQTKRASPTITTYSTAIANSTGKMSSAANGVDYATTVALNSDASFGAYWTQAGSSINATMQWIASAEL